MDKITKEKNIKYQNIFKTKPDIQLTLQIHYLNFRCSDKLFRNK